ncbi:hypothetical protein [Novipirellula sp.]|uniref:hypothetical protein n=1 Tax=Novipirellula sp. TaxID=2795430 RepID=UPI00356ABEFA
MVSHCDLWAESKPEMTPLRRSFTQGGGENFPVARLAKSFGPYWRIDADRTAIGTMERGAIHDFY